MILRSRVLDADEKGITSVNRPYYSANEWDCVIFHNLFLINLEWIFLLSHPCPSEEAKEELAKKHSVPASQPCRHRRPIWYSRKGEHPMTCLDKYPTGLATKESGTRLLASFRKKPTSMLQRWPCQPHTCGRRCAEQPDQVAHLANSVSSGSFPPKF